MASFTLLCGVFVVVLLYAEKTSQPTLRATAKTCASMCFIAVGVAAGGFDSAIGQWIMVGLVLCAAGDVFLLSDRPTLFRAGMAAFGLGHLAFATGFWIGGPPPAQLLIGTVLLTGLVVAPILRWMWPLLGSWRGPVAAYSFIIAIMVALALAGAVANSIPLLMMFGAIAFAASDISVAQDRLIKPDFRLRLWGLPLYYAAQVMIATSL